MKVSKEKLSMIREIFNKVDLMSFIATNSPPDIYEKEIKMMLDRIENPDTKDIEQVIKAVFEEIFGEDLDTRKFIHIPKMSSDIYRILMYDDFPDIDKITISYHREILFEDAEGYTLTEEITLDGKNETIIYRRKYGDLREISNIYYVPRLTSTFIYDYKLLFRYFGENNSVYAQGMPFVEINVYFTDGTTNRMIRSYDRHGMPDEWREFIDDLGTMIFSFRQFGDLFDEHIWGRGMREGEYIYLSVAFNEGSRKTYYYRTEDDCIDEGDFVIVPVGSENEEKIVYVEKKEYFKASELPMPLDKVKTVIGICDEEDLEF